MDDLDRRILAELQRDGRISLTELAERVQLSASPCHRRLRALEAAGIITGYRAEIDAHAVGLGFEALVFVTMNSSDAVVLADFEAAVLRLPNVLQAERLFGEPDYLLRIVSRDLAAFQALYDTRLGELPGVQRLTSTLVMKHVATDRPLPV